MHKQFKSGLVALDCLISPGGFSGERCIEIVLANGDPFLSISPKEFCWNSKGELVREPVSEAGVVAAKILDYLEDDQVLIEIPSSERVVVDFKDLKQRPTVIQQPSEKT